MYIEHKFTTLNEYVNAERSNKYIGAKIKREQTDIAYYSLLGTKPIQTPTRLKFTWYCANKRSDLDNICFAKKYILDGMVKAGIIPNDNMRHIIGFEDILIFSDKWAVGMEVY